MSEIRIFVEQKARRETNGVIRRSDALAAGMTSGQVDRRVRRRQWVPSGFSGRLILADSRDDPLAHLRCSVDATDGVVWRRSAMALWGLSGHPSTPDVLARRQSRSKAADLARYDPSIWAATRVDGFWCLTLEHTVASMAGVLTRDRFDELIDRVLLDGLTKWPQLAAAFKQVRRRGRRGSARIGRVLDDRGDGGVVPLVRLESEGRTRPRRRRHPRPSVRMADLRWRSIRCSGRPGVP